MRTTRRMTAAKITTAVLAAGISFALVSAVQAETLSFTNASASSAAAVMSKRYGVTIVIKSSVNTAQPVSFSVDNPDTPDGRLQAISDLASALDMDFQKVYVVSKVDPGAAVPKVLLDSNGPIVFSSTSVPVREAIQDVAAVDNATTQISSLITGTVSLPSTHMTESEAAAAISKQTGTEWKAYYGLFKRGDEPDRLAGAIIGTSNGGQPIRELPLLTYRSPASVTVPLHDGSDSVVGPLAPLSAIPDVVTVPNGSFGAVDPFGFGDPYGYTNPYGYANPFGTTTPGEVVTTPGMGTVTTVSPTTTTGAAITTTGTAAPGITTVPNP